MKTKTHGPANLLRQVDRDIIRTQRDIGELQDYLTQLQTVRADLSGAILTKARKVTPKPQGTRTDVLAAIIKDASEPIGVDQMVSELAKRGRPDDDKRLVHSTVSYLAKKGLARRVDKGLWTAVAA